MRNLLEARASDRGTDLASARDELMAGLRDGILPFWRERAVDADYGGYLTEFDADGRPRQGGHDKYLVTQARLVWSFSTFATLADDPDSVLGLARHGVDFLVEKFLDRTYGGWRWRVSRSGEAVDEAKLVYGQSFALYALAAYARASGEERARTLCEMTFDVLRTYAADLERGGYFENLERDWRLAGPGSAAGDRKSLDIHLHLLEALIELVRLTGTAVHAKRLREVRDLIRARMVDPVTGAGGTQYSLAYRPLPPIAIERTWIAERPGAAASPPGPANLTCYGHNLELAWLLAEADAVLGEQEASDTTIAALARHALACGYDHEYGGVFREGRADGDATDQDKEFWQNAEALVGFLEAHRVTGDEAFLAAFLGTWSFARTHLVHPEFGEWRIRTTRNGDVIVGDLGNAWKNAYHTGRAALESAQRLDTLLASRAGPTR